jgi:hypothetical protein
MSMPLGINKIWQHIAGGKKNDSVNLIVQRFLQAFQDHGIEASQIPRLLPLLKLDDLQSPEKLLVALTPEILDQTAKLFCISPQWLEGVTAHYSVVQIDELVAALNRITDEGNRVNRSLAMIRREQLGGGYSPRKVTTELKMG